MHDEQYDETSRLPRVLASTKITLTSDSHKMYPEQIRKKTPTASHVQVLSRRGWLVGQGELERGGFDPIFSLNHTAAMFRANVNRLARRTCFARGIDATVLR
jgi:hypothetical protein